MVLCEPFISFHNCIVPLHSPHPSTNKTHSHDHLVHGVRTQRQLSSQPLQQVRVNRPSIHAIFHSTLSRHPLSNSSPLNDSTVTGISSPSFTAFAMRSSLASSSPLPHRKDISAPACSTPDRVGPPASSPSPPTASPTSARRSAWRPARVSPAVKEARFPRAAKWGLRERRGRALGCPKPRGSDSSGRRGFPSPPSPSPAASATRPSIVRGRRCGRVPLAASHPA